MKQGSDRKMWKCFFRPAKVRIFLTCCLHSAPAKWATKTVLCGQPDDKNNFDQQPIAPVQQAFNARSRMDMSLPPYSFTMLEVEL